MSGSPSVVVRRFVVRGLDALPAYDKVSCKLGWTRGDQARERLFTTDARFRQEPASMRGPLRTHREERGSFRARIRVEGVGRDIDWTLDRATALGVVLEEWVADHRNTGLPGVEWLIAQGDGTFAERFNDRGTLVELSYTLAYQARLV